MRKHLIFYALILFSSLSPSAQEYHNESWYKSYFKEHITELDPLEGIYSVENNFTIIFANGETIEDNSLQKVVIIKKEEQVYIEYIIQGESGAGGSGYLQYTKYEKIGETSSYNSIWKWDCCSETATKRIYLESLLGFSYTIVLPKKVLKQTYPGNKQINSSTVKTTRSYIKDYPTRSMYEEVLSDTQEKEEEPDAPITWSGTGWALGNGYLVTNNHVSDGARTITIKGIGGDLNTGYFAEVVASDKTNDIAVLKIKDSRFNGFGTIPYAVSSRIAEKGEGIFVLGYPMTQVLGNEIKYTAGEINSRTGFQGDMATYQISAPVTHGNSGGPMFDSKGNVIGIVKDLLLFQLEPHAPGMGI